MQVFPPQHIRVGCMDNITLKLLLPELFTCACELYINLMIYAP